MTKVKLKAKTRKGKNRLRQFGEWWVVTRVTPTVLFSTETHGSWFLLESLNKKDWRWIRETDDPDFEIIGRWTKEKEIK